MRLAHRTITNALASFFGFASLTLSVLITTPYALARLDTEAYGIYILLFSTFGVLSLIDVGFAYSSIRFIAEARVQNNINKITTIINMNLWSYLAIGGAIVLAIVLATNPIIDWLKVPIDLRDQARIGLWLIVLSLPLYLAMNVYAAVIQAYQKYIFLNVITVINAVSFTSLTIVVLYLQPSIINLMILNLVSAIMTLTGYIIIVKRLLPSYHLNFLFEWSLFKKIINFSVYTFIMIITDRIIVQADKFFINRALGATAVTYYSIPSAMGVKLHGVMHNINQVVFPLTAELDTQQRKEELVALYQQANKIGWAGLMILALPIYIFSDLIIQFWLGPDYINPSGWLLKISMIGYSLFTLISLPTALLAGLDLQKQNTFFHVLAVITNLICLVLLIPRFGLAGAAWAFVIGQWPVILMYRYCERKIGVSLRQQLLLYTKCIISIVLLGLLLQWLVPWVSNLWTLGLALTFSVVVITLICLLVIFNRDDRTMFLTYVQQWRSAKS